MRSQRFPKEGLKMCMSCRLWAGKTKANSSPLHCSCQGSASTWVLVKGSARSKGGVQNSKAQGNHQEDQGGTIIPYLVPFWGTHMSQKQQYPSAWGSLPGQGIPFISRGGGRPAQAPMAEQNGWRCGTGVGGAGEPSWLRIPAKGGQ